MNQQDCQMHQTNEANAAQPDRRLFLQASALAAAATLSQASANASATAPTTAPSAPMPASASVAAAKREAVPGNFDFLTGEWRIQNRRRKKTGTEDWDVFPGEASVWSILGGICSIEELRIPARQFSGMGLRLLDLDKKVWIDHWVNGKSGVISLPGTEGHFINGDGIFRGEWLDADKQQTWQVYSAWDRITPDSCRWHQSISQDGKTWEEQWSMDWVRVAARPKMEKR